MQLCATVVQHNVHFSHDLWELVRPVQFNMASSSSVLCDAELIALNKFAAEFLESSDSSDSSIERMVLLKSVKRVKPKIVKFIQHVVHRFSDLEFKANFRVERSTCNKLVEGFRNSDFYPKDLSHGGSPPNSAENHVLCFLWFAANKCSLRDVSQRFGIGQTSAFREIQRVMNYLVQIAPSYIKFPSTPEEKQQSANDFEQVSGMPDVLGCIDGTSINIRTPAHKIKSTYVNRHDIPSITMQGICDSNRKFIDVFTGTPGKIHDSRVHRLSFVSRKLPELCTFEGYNKFHLLGDSAYPIREWLLTPFRDYGNLTETEVNFNRIFCATRVLIENAFGILKGRFRQLERLDIHKVDKITKFIISCCVIHNMCIDDNDEIDIEERINSDNAENQENDEREREIVLKRLGEEKRNRIQNLLL